MKKEKIPTFIIIPMNGRSKAPGIAVTANKYSDALKEAKSRSRLSDFNNWVFI